MATVGEPTIRGDRLRAALLAGAALWLALLGVGFIAPGGWKWGLPGPFGHVMNYMIALWSVTLVLAPVLASLAPLHATSSVRVYLLGLLAIIVSSVRGDELELLSDGLPIAAAVLSAALVVWAHPDRPQLWRASSGDWAGGGSS